MPGKGDRGGKKERPKDARGVLRRILSYLTDFRLILLFLLFLTLLSNIGNLLGPSFAGKAIRAASGGAGRVDFPGVFHYARLMLLVYLFSNLTSFAVSLSMMRLGRSVAERMRRDVFDKLLKLPVSYFDRNQAGDILSRVSYDIDVITTSLSTDVVQIMTSSVTVAGSFLMMLLLSPPLLFCVLITIPMAFAYTGWMGKHTRPLYAKRSRAYGEMNGFVEEMFSGQKTILAYAYEGGVCKRFSEINRAAAEAYRDADSLGMTIGPTVGFISNTGLTLIALAGALLYRAGTVDLAQISSFVLYSRKFAGPINEISNIINEIYSALAAAERVFALLDEPEEPADSADAVWLGQVPDIQDAAVPEAVAAVPGAGVQCAAAQEISPGYVPDAAAPGTASAVGIRGEVEARHVAFGYHPGKTILHDLNLHAAPGETIAIVGPTGAGKTTIINLLMRFYDTDAGEILTDGIEIRKLKRKSLRRAYAMVLQDTWVFRGTIFDNIAYGKEGAGMDEVTAAARAARIHSYIMRLPKGYETEIGEDGSGISKGQKQLLTIARAMLYNTNMLILDEATSNVDTNTERQVQKAMRQLMRGKTSFVIAHRLSTIQNADRILVVDHGDVVEQGTHEELMALRGFYYRLYASQWE